MSNYYGNGRSNYVALEPGKEVEFSKLVQAAGGKVISIDIPGGKKFGLISKQESGDLFHSKNEEELFTLDILIEIAAMMVEGEVLVWIESGHAGDKVISGISYAVNKQGKAKAITLDSIYDHAKVLGENISRAEY